MATAFLSLNHETGAFNIKQEIEEELTEVLPPVVSWSARDQEESCPSFAIQHNTFNSWEEIQEMDLKPLEVKTEVCEDSGEESAKCVPESDFIEDCLDFTLRSLAVEDMSKKTSSRCSIIKFVQCPSCGRCYKGTDGRLLRLILHVKKRHKSNAQLLLRYILKKYQPLVKLMHERKVMGSEQLMVQSDLGTDKRCFSKGGQDQSERIGLRRKKVCESCFCHMTKGRSRPIGAAARACGTTGYPWPPSGTCPSTQGLKPTGV